MWPLLISLALAGDPVAVVELFTSEGCSSCPPADAVLRELVADDHAHVFPLSFHVDYWNGLGWVDPFSDAAWTARQRAYARDLGTGRLYTPQAVVNGTHELVGSRGDGVRALVEGALDDPAPHTITAVATWSDDDTLEVRVDTDAEEPVVITLVQRTARSVVERGENAGRALSHAHVVRALNRTQDGEVSFSRPEDLDKEELFVVAFVQGDDLRITGATRAIPE